MSRVLLLPTSELGPYQRKRATNFHGISPAMRFDLWLAARGIERIPDVPIANDWMAFHPWRAGWLPITHAEAERVRTGDTLDAFAQLDWIADGALDLVGVTARAVFDFGALQNPWELERFLGRIAGRPLRTIVEIGTSAGGLLFALAQLADLDATLISIDISDPRDSVALRYAIPTILRGLVRPTQTFAAFRESSMAYSVREDLRRTLDGRTIDLLVIDGDHSYGGVRSDFEMYSPLVGTEGLIAFHDILCTPENTARGCDVGIVWQELAKKHRTETIVDEHGAPGLPPRPDASLAPRPAALGWGLLQPH